MKLLNFKERFISNTNCHFDPDEDFHLLSPIILVEDNHFLTSVVGRDEIKEAVFNLALDKSHDPDGFPPFFLKNIGC